jgi:FtsZ-binding cell division protein ZapB
MEILFVITAGTLLAEGFAFVLLMKHIKQIRSEFNMYQKNQNDADIISETIDMYQEKIIELEEKNNKLSIENKLLQEKLSKINKQMKQISDHFKTN